MGIASVLHWKRYWLRCEGAGEPLLLGLPRWLRFSCGAFDTEADVLEMSAQLGYQADPQTPFMGRAWVEALQGIDGQGARRTAPPGGAGDRLITMYSKLTKYTWRRYQAAYAQRFGWNCSGVKYVDDLAKKYPEGLDAGVRDHALPCSHGVVGWCVKCWGAYGDAERQRIELPE